MDKFDPSEHHFPWKLPVSSSTVRRCGMTSSSVYRFLGMIVTSLVAVQSNANFHPGPD